MRCLMDETFAEFERRYRPRSDGSPGREVACEICGGVWSISKGGTPAECQKSVVRETILGDTSWCGHQMMRALCPQCRDKS